MMLVLTFQEASSSLDIWMSPPIHSLASAISSESPGDRQQVMMGLMYEEGTCLLSTVYCGLSTVDCLLSTRVL